MKSDTPLIDRTFDATGAAIHDQDGRLVAAIICPGEQDIARRLVTCWNAFRGVATTDIERGRVEVHRVNVAVGVNKGSIQIGGPN